MDWIQPHIGTIVGGCIGLLSSLLVLWITRWSDRRGKLIIFCKRTNAQNNPWGFKDDGSGLVCLFIPLDVEIMNTSNVNRLIRDFSLSAWRNGTRVFKAKQLDRMTNTTKTKDDFFETSEKQFGSKNSSYSFIAEARSVHREKYAFAFATGNSNVAQYQFDEIRIEYSDEKGKIWQLTLAKYAGNWEVRDEKPDEEWIELK